MSKVLTGTCLAGQVFAEGLPVLGAVILSEGLGPSEGVVILEDDEITYLARTSPDLKTTLEQLTSALTTIATTLTAIGAGMTGATTAPPPTLPAGVTAINAAATALTALKAVLK
jgi:hypothetical protein